MYAQGSSVYHSSYNAFLSPGETLAELSAVRLFFWSFFLFMYNPLSVCLCLSPFVLRGRQKAAISLLYQLCASKNLKGK